MELSELTKDLLNELFEIREGQLFRRVSRGRMSAGNLAGSPTRLGYWNIGIGVRKYSRAKLIWCMVHGYIPKELDHKNRDYSDDRIENLRESTRSQNCANRKEMPRGVDLPRGVYRCRGKFMARLAAGGKDFFSSARDTPEEAFEVYKKMHRKRYGEFSPFESKAI
jgi:hypothetical protein